MADSRIFTPSQVSIPTANGPEGAMPPPTIILQSAPSFWGRWSVRLLLAALGLSVMFNFGLFSAYREYCANTEPPLERFHSGNETATDKIALRTAQDDNRVLVSAEADFGALLTVSREAVRPWWIWPAF